MELNTHKRIYEWGEKKKWAEPVNRFLSYRISGLFFLLYSYKFSFMTSLLLGGIKKKSKEGE